MKNQHTPGPWEVGAYASGLSIIVQDTTGWVPGHIPRVIVQAFDYDCLKAIPGKPITGEKEANAHLIAAAPEMLEALEAIINECGDTLESLSTAALGVIAIKARQAVAKAKGRDRL